MALNANPAATIMAGASPLKATAFTLGDIDILVKGFAMVVGVASRFSTSETSPSVAATPPARKIWSTVLKLLDE
jgi:hypothetical protein